MTTNTYIPIDAVTLTSNASDVTFSSIPGGYTDLIVVIMGASTTAGSSTNGLRWQINGDTGSNYSETQVYGDGSTATSTSATNATDIGAGLLMQTSAGYFATNIIQFMNYSNTTTYKTILTHNGGASVSTAANVALWRSTSAITSIKFYRLSDQLKSGSTFSLYGIKAQGTESSPKATGGYIYSDSTYYYHVFPFSSTFIPNQSLSCDLLVVAGGGGGGWAGGGGGAGGYRTANSQSFTATTYTVTVGSGGNGGTSGSKNGVSGSNSSISPITSTGGGGGGGYSNGTAGSGGSGGGAGADPGSGSQTGGSGNAGSYSPVEGYAGGNSILGASYSGGGGGASAAGTAGNTVIGGNGGNGSNSRSSWANATLTGVDGYYAGGGAGHRGIGGLGGGGIGGYTGTGSFVNGVVSTGGGGGAGGANGTNGGNGGSGIVIVRYAK